MVVATKGPDAPSSRAPGQIIAAARASESSEPTPDADGGGSERSVMTLLDRIRIKTGALREACTGSVSVFLRDVGNGLLEVSHNSLALLGLFVVTAVLFILGRADLRQSIETTALGWLQARHEARVEPAEVEAASLAEPDAVSRATAAHPSVLTRQQAAVAHWLARRYRVAPEPVSRLVQEAWAVGPRVGVEPTLILAIMAIESSFNPFAQSPVGAQGLMQVMTRVHDEKYERFGGILAAFDPVANLKVGVQVLKECIARAGSVEAGLRYYVGAGNQADDNGYAGKVLAEQGYLKHVAGGKAVPATAPLTGAAPAARSPAAPPAKVEEMPDPEHVALLR
jgi:Transglycosylase SLT domain